MKVFLIMLVCTVYSVTVSAQENISPSTPSSQPLTDYIAGSSVLDVQPTYPGGLQEFYNFIGHNFVVPQVDTEMAAKISLSFVIGKDGSLADIKILKDPGYGMGDEAVRILKLCPKKWIPGYKNGSP